MATVATADAPAGVAAPGALYERIAPAAVSTPSAGTPANGTSRASSASHAPANPAAAAGRDSRTAASPHPQPLPPGTSRTVVVPDSEISPPSLNAAAASPVNDHGYPPSTTEIPPVLGNSRVSVADAEHQQTNAMAVEYSTQQDPRMIDPRMRSLQDFMREGDESSPIGVDLREAQRKLASGEVANGLLIVGVREGSAAAQSGLHASRRTARDILEGVAIAASLFFPPAVLAVPVIDQVKLHESYDMIIGVDGTRVVSYLDFEDSMRDVEPGEIVYLSIVRNGKRIQVPVHVGTMSYAPF